jgi:hypothetical protein
MQRRSLLRGWPLLVVALATACSNESTTPGSPTGTGGTGGSASTDGGKPDVAIPPGDGGLSPCALDLPTVLDRPPSGSLPCDLLPPGFVSP